MSNKVLYKLDDDILFRKCSLFDENLTSFGDCTNFNTKRIGYEDCYVCKQEGLHFHCAKHPEIELEDVEDDYISYLYCPKCDKEFEIGSYSILTSRCLKALNRDIFKDAELMRLDDWYIPEIKVKEKPTPDYRVITNVKTDKDGDTIVVIYVTYEGSKDKAQLFIKPEKLQLSNDYKDLDPSKVLSKIELTLKDRTITQEYDE